MNLSPEGVTGGRVGAGGPICAERPGVGDERRLGAPTVLTDVTSAELVKYAANAFLAPGSPTTRWDGEAQYAPSPRSTAPTVFHRISASSARDQFST